MDIAKAQSKARFGINNEARMQEKAHIAVVAYRSQMRIGGFESPAVCRIIDLGCVLNAEYVFAFYFWDNRIDECFLQCIHRDVVVLVEAIGPYHLGVV